jgi:hypothetical protein
MTIWRMLCLAPNSHIPVLQYQITQTQHQPNSHIHVLQYQITQTQHQPNSHIPVLQYQITKTQHLVVFVLFDIVV